MKQVNINNLHERTALEVFEFIENHLLTQNQKSTDGDDCFYRLENLKCAAGCLIPDEKYDPKFEGKNWKGLVDNDFAPKDHFHLIMELQSIHDSIAVEYWKPKLEELKIKLCNTNKET